tara:strand:- start:2057 stop:3820 length:1764 start_codon:yes stop_codon:yes gene_type:complete
MPVSINTHGSLGVGIHTHIVPPATSSFDGFIMELTVTGTSAFQLRGRAIGTYNYDVDWGDGTIDTVTTYNGGSHTYSSTGTYLVKISGDFSGFEYGTISGGWKDYLTKIVQWGNIQWKSFYQAFTGFDNLNSLPTDYPDISGLTDTRARKMFYNLPALTSCDLSNWQNTGNFSGDALGMLYGFLDCTNINLTGWDTSNMTNTQDFMAHCGRTAGGCTVTAPNLDFSGTNTLYRMFYRACVKANSDVSNWTLNASGVSLARFFYESGAFSSPTFAGVTELDMSTWNNTSGINNMQYYAYNSSALKNINVTNWDTSNVTDMYRAFYGCLHIQEIAGLSTIDISSVTDAREMFFNTRKLKFDNHNFGPSWNNWAACTTTFAKFFYRNGYSLAAVDAGPPPTVSAWSMPSATGNIQELFREAQYASGSTITLNWNYPACTSFLLAFFITKGVSTININMTTTNALTSLKDSFKQASSLSSIIFGSNMDFSGVTDMSSAFFQISTTPTTLTFDASADFGALTTIGSLVGSGSTRKMTTASYDALLVRLEATNSNTVTLNVNASQYTAGSAADTARTALIADHSWTISDGGSV